MNISVFPCCSCRFLMISSVPPNRRIFSFRISCPETPLVCRVLIALFSFFQSIVSCPPPPRKRSSQSAGRRGKRDQRSGSVEPSSATREKAGQGDGESTPVKTASVAWLPANNFPTRDAGAPRSTASGMRLAVDSAEEESMSGDNGDCSVQVSVE
jgi:hypothetical protein